MTQDIGRLNKMIYVRQNASTVCIHQMDYFMTEDTVEACANETVERDLTHAATVDGLDYGPNVPITEMYVCTNYIKNEGKLRIQVRVPSLVQIYTPMPLILTTPYVDKIFEIFI